MDQEINKEAQWRRLVAQNLNVEDEPMVIWKGIIIGFLLGVLSTITLILFMNIY